MPEKFTPREAIERIKELYVSWPADHTPDDTERSLKILMSLVDDSPCVWTLYFDPDYISTECGQEFVAEILEEGLENSGYNYCPGCGRPVEVKN